MRRSTYIELGELIKLDVYLILRTSLALRFDFLGLSTVSILVHIYMSPLPGCVPGREA